MKTRLSIRRIIRLAGAFVACAIGSGFATGQEILQFFSGYGISGIWGTLITTVIFSFVGAFFMRHGCRYKLNEPKKITKLYFGEKAGGVLETVFQVFLYGVFVIMIAGAGATLSEFFGLSPMVGRIGITVLCFVTVILGLERLADILGGIGPVIIVCAIGVGIYGLCTAPDTMRSSLEFARAASIERASGNGFWSSVLYPGFNAVVVLILSCSLGSTAENEREAEIGGLLGGLLFGLAVLVMNLGLVANAKEVFGKAVPTLVLAGRLSNVFAIFFAVIICCGIYTTAVPMLWGCVRHFAQDGTNKSVLLTLLFAAVGLVLGMTDFKVLVNTIYPFSGYAGILLILAAAFLEYRDRRSAVLRTDSALSGVRRKA